MNGIARVLAGSVFLAAFSAAHAQTTGLRMDSGFYLGAGIGRSEARDVCQNLSGACDAKDVTWNVYAGYQINRYAAVELGYSDFGDATTSGFVGGVASRLRMNTKALELVGVGRLPLGEHFAVYGKLGFFRYDSDGTATGGLVDASSDKGTELTFGLGGEYDFDGRFAVRVEWQRYLGVGSGVIGLGKADISAVRAGMRYKF